MRTSCRALVLVGGTLSLLVGDLANADVLSDTTLGQVPRMVREIANRQVVQYLGMLDFTGVPLLDPEVDWNCLTNWPRRFSWQGRSYLLDLPWGYARDEGSAECMPSALVNTDRGWLVKYLPDSGTVKTGMVVLASTTWRNSRYPVEKALTSADKAGVLSMVFCLQYYTNGSLYRFHWSEPDRKVTHHSVFDCDGRLVGNCSDGGPYEWNGRRVDGGVFERLCGALYKQGGVPKQRPVQPSAAPKDGQTAPTGNVGARGEGRRR